MHGGYGGDAVRDGVGHDAGLNAARRVPRKLTIVLINGQKLRLSFGDFWQIITDRYSLIYFLVADGLVAYLYPVERLIGLPWWHVVTVFVVMAFVVIAALTGLFAILLRFLHRFDRLGSRLIEHHSQNKTVASSMIAEKNVSGHRSYRFATRRQSLRRPNMISMRLRRL